VPLQEQSTYQDVFGKMDTSEFKTPAFMTVMLSVTISTDKTVVWFDHWEDGFDVDVTNPLYAMSKTTEIWGDGNAANGCSPHIAKVNCTNVNDILNAGTSIVMRNDVPLPRDAAANVLYDGGDKILSSFPVAVTRASFPRSPGSVMAGAVEVYDTSSWGSKYEAPVGEGTQLIANGPDPFGLSGFSCMAMEDQTKVTVANGTVFTLKQGQSIYVTVKKSDQVTSDKPIQVILLTAQRGSHYQTRWFTMRPIGMYTDKYVSPVGDNYGRSRVILYNPSTTGALTYNITTLVNGVLTKVSNTLVAKQALASAIIPTGSGALVEASANLVALSYTDTENQAGSGDTGGNRYDWGIPLLPRNELTSQVLIGLGYGCTNNACGTNTVRSPIWLTYVTHCLHNVCVVAKWCNAARISHTPHRIYIFVALFPTTGRWRMPKFTLTTPIPAKTW
jgi:IgGFc binding protein